VEQLYYDKDNKSYLLVLPKGDNVFCFLCRELVGIGGEVIIQRSASKTQYLKRFWCSNCISQHKKQIYDEFTVAIVGSSFPVGARLVPDLRPSLSASRVDDTFTLANKSRDGEKVIDKTRLAGRESLEGVSIGVMPEEKPKITTEDQLVKELETIKKGKMLQYCGIKGAE